MVTYKTLSRWDADLTFKNEAEYEAFRAQESASGRIETIKNELKKEEKLLVNPRMSVYIEETKEIIEKLKNDLKVWEQKEQEATKAREEALNQPEEYGRL
jgi:hypothetical protein